ncbi:MAG TPA: hypothetical protein VMT24_09030, partial [Aggregatilineaceae bacterium]|nr:hypothetical protein [Aggregatilineaceae bacterium]
SQQVGANAAPVDYIKKFFGAINITVDPQPATLGSMAGAKVHVQATQQDQNGQTPVDAEMWVLTLDNQTSLVISSALPSREWTAFKPTFDQVVGSLKVNVPVALRVINAQAGTAAATAATTVATPAPTANPTTAATPSH